LNIQRKHLILVLVLVMVTAIVMPVSAKKISDNPNPNLSFSQDNIRKEMRKKYEFDYKPYINGKKELGFKPNKDLFQKVYYFIRLKYVKPVTNQALAEGVIKEVKRLLKQANVNSSGLDKMAGKGILFEEIVERYGDKVDPDLIKYACIRGMLEALDDPHSILMLPKEYKRLQESMSGGNFSGIGVFIMQDPDNQNWLTVSEPIEGTPAYKAGLQPGDTIIAVDGKTTKDEPIDLSVSRIRGPEGTKVVLTIKRKGRAKPFDVPIVRKFIHVNSVKFKMLPHKIGYIKLRIYSKESGAEIEKALRELERKGAKAIILDVRNNSGGMLDAAYDVCSKFLPAGSPIVGIKSRGSSMRVHRARGGMHPELPMVLLINELSASASEITAGALKDNGRAMLIGARTFGKGSVQVLEPIYLGSADPAALKLTVSLFYTPRGLKVNGEGLKPHVKVPQDVRDAGLTKYEKKKDKQLQKAINYLKKKI